MEYENIDFKVLRAADKMNTWHSCQSAFRGIVWARLASEVKKLPQTLESQYRVKQIVAMADRFSVEFFVLKNMTDYLVSGTSFAPWFHLGSVFRAIQGSFPEMLRWEAPKVQRQPLLDVLHQHLSSDSPQISPRRALLKSGSSPVLSSVERAALLFAEADFLRTTRVPGIPGAGGSLGPERDEMNALVHTGQRFLVQAYRQTKASAPAHMTDLYGLFMVLVRTPVPIFELLDRLDSQVLESIHLKDSLTHPHAPFYVHVLPTPNVESNHVRSFYDLHCDAQYKGLVSEHQEAHRPLTIVEVGTHLGGCVLWAMAHLPRQTRALAIDAYGPAIAALRRTVEANGFADRMTVVERFICPEKRKFQVSLRQTGTSLVQPSWSEATEESSQTVECSSLESVLEEHSIAEVDLMRIHVLGREYDALRSAESFLQMAKVKVLALSVTHGNTNPGEMAAMLLRHGYVLEFLEFFDEDVVTILSNQALLPKSTQTMIARYPR